jgi:hypothetical protein
LPFKGNKQNETKPTSLEILTKYKTVKMADKTADKMANKIVDKGAYKGRTNWLAKWRINFLTK